jgi:aminoglycoside phosphotransferase (APT) family kinase protein
MMHSNAVRDPRICLPPPVIGFLSRLLREDVVGARPVGGGSSNVTVLVETPARRLVLRHGPVGHGLASAHDMAREYRVILALQDTAVPVPRTIAFCSDSSLLGAEFYVMEYIDGVILAAAPPVQPMPSGFAESLEERRSIGLALVRSLVDLHSVDFADVGLGEFGRPAGYAERQVKRWAEQWETWKTRESPAMEELLHRLRRATPVAHDHAIVHGDYRLGNCILDRDDPGRVLGILDWEMSTLGDPIADLGYTLVYWGEETDDTARFDAMDLSRITARPGFLTRADLVKEYARLSGRDVSSVDFFEMLARLKLAIFGERGYARIRAAERTGTASTEAPSRSEGRRRCDEHVQLALQVGDDSEDHRLRGT